MFKFWALLDYGDGGYERAILDCIGDKWGEMLYAGATTFYETEDGEEAFSRAGSLSHGWSAVPIIFLDRILNEKQL